ncbi:hypothetical protein [Streptococcus marmotae]|uniref:hypothetical protein n=1 Tax=Streptococcus marmotae TaxID=1825069 RepID=UPI0008337CBD|nr:hypothetical protein [Streptococcus marmotae]
MNTTLKKSFLVSSAIVLLSSNIVPIVVLAEEANTNVGYMPTESVENVVYFSNSDVHKAAENLYNQDVFTKEQYQKICSIFAQRLGVKGVNKVVNLGNGMTDVYINNITWSAMVAAGGGAMGLLLGAIPHISASVAGMIGAIGGGVGGAYLSADRGVIVRLKQVYEPPTQISGAKLYPKVIGIREQ